MRRTYGRLTIDDRGVRRAALLWFFGTPFDVAWADLTGWALVKQALAGRGFDYTMSQTLELHTAGKVYFIDGSGPAFSDLVAEVSQRLPGKEVESILITMRGVRGLDR